MKKLVLIPLLLLIASCAVAPVNQTQNKDNKEKSKWIYNTPW